MPEITFKSAGVSTREIDLTAPSGIAPVGTPAGIIGTANQGPAFVPVTVATFQEFTNKFGSTDGEKFGLLAVNEWLKNAQAATYVRVLGAGNGKKRTTSGNNQGNVTNSGFVVGDRLPQSDGRVGRNLKALDNGVPGRVHFLGCFMSQSAGSTIFSDAGITKLGDPKAHPIIRGIIFAASGVVPMLSGTHTVNPTFGTAGVVATSTGPRGGMTGSVNLSSSLQEFVVLLNGHVGTDTYSNILTASFDMTAGNYFANVFNRDALKIEEAGYVLFSHYDIHNSLAVVTGVGIYGATASFSGSGLEDVGFLTTGSLARNSGSTIVPSYENYEDRFRTPASPWIISQKFGGSAKNLFKVWALSDGEYANTKFKLSVRNVAKSTSDVDLHGSFDLLVRDYFDTDDNPKVLEQFLKVNLDPSSDRYIARIVGDQRTYFDFDRAVGAQKIVLAGENPNKSKLIRVEMASEVEEESIASDSLPMGFRGPHHLITSGTDYLATVLAFTGAFVGSEHTQILKRAVEIPIPFRDKVTTGASPKEIVNSSFHWGVQFERKESISEPNKTTSREKSIDSFVRYHPKFHTSWQNPFVGDNAGTANANGAILDSDVFNNNMFTLENVQVRTGSNLLADPKEWVSASYVRLGSISANEANKTRAFKVDDLDDLTARSHAKFSLFMQGGFDGINVFNKQKRDLTNTAVFREMDDASAQGGDQGPTVSAYRKALDTMGSKTDVDVKILAIPGIRHAVITDYAVNIVENRFDAMYVMDISERDALNTVVTASTQEINVANTVSTFLDRGLNTSFAAAYFPDVVVTDPTTKTNVDVPPSTVVLGAISLNDRVAHPWFAPAGFTRGALGSVLETKVKLNQKNLDTLYEADINPLTSFPGSSGVVVWGQKTLLAAQSALDRVNVRRLLIEIRRQVRLASDQILFEPNRESTLARFTSLVTPILQRAQERSGVDRYKVVIDSSTTTQADVENNTVRGKIYLQPSRTAEFISLDFVVTNVGNV